MFSSPKYALALASLLVGSTVASSALATPGKCLRGIVRGYPNYVKKRLVTLQKCEDGIVRGAFPVGYDCLTDPVVVSKLETAVRNLRKTLGGACGGNNHVCNAGDTGHNADETLASIGWDIGACPDFESSGCTNAITDCNDIVDCMVCTTGAAETQVVTLYDGAFNVPASDRSLTKCQREIGKRSAEFFWKRLRALEKCERKVLSGDLSGPCPDPGTQQDITTLGIKLEAKICRECGGADKLCGGAVADRTTTEIGFTPSCPDVTIPGGGMCSGAIAALGDITACVECVSEFKTDCLDALSVPGMKPYPAECNAVP